MNNFREDFPELLDELIYFDNASTTQKPYKTIDAISNFYKNNNASLGKGIYQKSIEASEKFEYSRKNIAEFFGAKSEEIFFTNGATDSLNQLSYGLEHLINKDDKIIITEIEHHSNLLPWIRLAKNKGAKLDYISINNNGELNYDELDKKIDSKVKIIAFTAVSNVLGNIIDIKKFTEKAKQVGAITVLDAVQLAPHRKIDFSNLDVDFGVIAPHKLFGPTGIGIIFGKNFDKLKPFKLGGGIVVNASMNFYELVEPPILYEAGTQNAADVVGFSATIDYLKENDIFNLDNENILKNTLYNGLKELDFVKILGTNNNKIPVISFLVDGVHPHDVSQFLASKNIAIRAGHHCSKPLHSKLGINATNRASMVFYNSLSEIETFILAIKHVKEYF